jgi:hypothetical protein
MRSRACGVFPFGRFIMTINNGRQVRHPVATASFRTISLLALATAAIAFAVGLRSAAGNAAREQITNLLGYEGRALLEHFLAGFGIPLGLVMSLYALAWVLEKGWDRVRKLDKRRKPTGSLDDYADVKTALIATAFISVLYIGLELRFEWLEATQSVYGGPPRGHFQWGQFGADIAGALTACYLLARFRRNRAT